MTVRLHERFEAAREWGAMHGQGFTCGAARATILGPRSRVARARAVSLPGQAGRAHRWGLWCGDVAHVGICMERVAGSNLKMR